MSSLYEVWWKKSLKEFAEVLEREAKGKCSSLGEEVIRSAIEYWKRLGYDPEKPILVNMVEDAKHLSKCERMEFFNSIVNSLLSMENGFWCFRAEYLDKELLRYEEIERDVSSTLEKIAQALELEISQAELREYVEKICREYKRSMEKHIKLRKKKVDYVE